MSRTFVVADTHGKPELLLKLLETTGFVSPVSSERINTHDKLVHIGDLANCVASSEEGDITCLQIGRDFFDILLVGNHEYPYLGGTGFGGYKYLPSVEVAITECEDKWLPSYCVGNTLLTHAGLVEDFESLYAEDATADEIHLDLVQHWLRDPLDLVFRACSYQWRGGPDSYGGILWADEHEPKIRSINQVFGYTPQRSGKIVESWSANRDTFWANIDAGAKWDQANLTGVWLREDGTIEGLPVNVTTEG